MKYPKYTWGQLEALLNILGGEKVVDGILSRTIEIVTKVVSYLVATSKQVVNYDRSIADSVGAGKYGGTDDNITDENFPSKEEGKREVEFGLFHFNKMILPDEAILKMKNEGFRPATMKELLAYGEKNPEVQCKFPIVGLGSVALVAQLSSNRHVGCLDSECLKREVGIGCYDLYWAECCRFLGVRI